MKKAVFFLLASCMLLLSCGTVRNNVRRKHFITCPESEMYRNSDGSKNFYVVDSIPFDTAYYEVVEHNKGRFRFYVPKGYIEKHRRASDYTLLREKFPIFGAPVRNLYNFMDVVYTDEAIPNDILRKYDDGWSFIKYTHKRFSSYTIWRFAVPPTYLRVFMIRGNCYNQAVRIPSEIVWPLRFPNEKAYYKVVIPVWSDKPLEPKKLEHSYVGWSMGKCRIAAQEKAERANNKQ